MQHFKNIAKQIKELDMFDNSTSLAFSIIEIDPNLENLSDEHIKTLMWLNTIAPLVIAKQDYPEVIARAILMGEENIKNVINEISILLQIENKKIYSQIRKRPEILLVSIDQVRHVYNYLKDVGFSEEQINNIFFKAILLEPNILHQRCELALKYWNADELYYMAQQGFLSDLPYSDVIEAVDVAVETLGANEAIKFFHSYSPFFVEYRDKWYRTLPIDIFLYENAITALNNYKKSN